MPITESEDACGVDYGAAWGEAGQHFRYPRLEHPDESNGIDSKALVPLFKIDTDFRTLSNPTFEWTADGLDSEHGPFPFTCCL